MQAPVTATCRR